MTPRTHLSIVIALQTGKKRGWVGCTAGDMVVDSSLVALRNIVSERFECEIMKTAQRMGLLGLLALIRRFIWPLVEELVSPESLCSQLVVEFLFRCRCIDTQRLKCGSGILEGVEGIVNLLIKQMRLIEMKVLNGILNLGKSGKLNHDSLSMTMPVAIDCDEVSAAFLTNYSTVLPISLLSSRIDW